MTKAEQVVVHLLRRMRSDPRLAYYIGPFTRSYEMLTEVGAELEGCSVDEFRRLYEADLQTEPPTDAADAGSAGS